MPKKMLFAAATLLLLSSLNARAAYIDLTTAGATGTGTAAIGSNFYVQQISPQSTGSGVIDPFLRVDGQHGTEQGYNTSLGLPLDDQPPATQYVHKLLLSDVPIVTLTVNGQTHQYYQFLLDVNQNTGGQGADQLLSLNQIQIFQSTIDRMDSNTPTQTSGSSPILAFDGSAGGSVSEVFRFNNSGDVRDILLDYALNSGSGSGDMFLNVRVEDFTGPGNYVILYSQFGSPPGGSGANDGFEEWAVLQGNTTQAVPAPPAFLLMGLGAAIMGFVARRRREVVAP